MQSSILWFTNSFLNLKPFLFNTLLPSTTIALSKLPPLAKPRDFNLSISSNLQKVLELYISNKSSFKIFTLYFWFSIKQFGYFISNSISELTDLLICMNF